MASRTAAAPSAVPLPEVLVQRLAARETARRELHRVATARLQSEAGTTDTPGSENRS